VGEVGGDALRGEVEGEVAEGGLGLMTRGGGERGVTVTVDN
jgi:hypothetical protein